MCVCVCGLTDFPGEIKAFCKNRIQLDRISHPFTVSHPFWCAKRFSSWNTISKISSINWLELKHLFPHGLMLLEGKLVLQSFAVFDSMPKNIKREKSIQCDLWRIHYKLSRFSGCDELYDNYKGKFDQNNHTTHDRVEFWWHSIRLFRISKRHLWFR